MKYSIIDIGTNTSRLAIFEAVEPESPELVYEKNIITRLGEGLHKSGLLSEAAIDRTLEAMRVFKAEAQKAGSEKIKTVGTAALRDASNAEKFVESADGIGLSIEILSDEQEAVLTFEGVVTGLKKLPEKILAVDVGGGSAEFSYGDPEKLISSKSLPIGAVAMTEKFFANDPPAGTEIEEMEDYVVRQFESIAEAGIADDFLCVGTAGTISTLAMMDLGLVEFDPGLVHGHIIKREALDELTERLMNLDSMQRRSIPGMESGRADIIHAGALVFSLLMENFGIKEIYISLYDLRHGLLGRMMK
ncbi:MAG TPA: Ppx/GppA phosphatase family protein [bacterium]|nr:Ppx/GppA phosphatase family protein [bacterium]